MIRLIILVFFLFVCPKNVSTASDLVEDAVWIGLFYVFALSIAKDEMPRVFSLINYNGTSDADLRNVHRANRSSHWWLVNHSLFDIYI